MLIVLLTICVADGYILTGRAYPFISGPLILTKTNINVGRKGFQTELTSICYIDECRDDYHKQNLQMYIYKDIPNHKSKMSADWSKP